MPPGTRKKRTPAEIHRYDRDRRVQVEPLHADAKQPLYQGIMDELVRPVGRNPLTIWMLGWRCKRCGHVWPVRRMLQKAGERKGEYIEPKVMSGEPTRTPKKCPGCDSQDWWKDYRENLSGPRRAGRRRQPYMLKSWKDQQGLEDDADLARTGGGQE